MALRIKARRESGRGSKVGRWTRSDPNRTYFAVRGPKNDWVVRSIGWAGSFATIREFVAEQTGLSDLVWSHCGPDVTGRISIENASISNPDDPLREIVAWIDYGRNGPIPLWSGAGR